MRLDYMTLKDGVLHGLKECFIRKRSGYERPYTRGRYRHGIPVGVHHHYYENGICSVRKKYGNPCNNRSRVLKLDAWMPSGKKCPKSHIDESGDGVHYVYSDFYRKLREIHFYANHELRSLLILDEKGKLKDVLSNLHTGNLYEWSLAG
jgi:antitoxin component YwqK of YwqJK toxin-antitoxin module